MTDLRDALLVARNTNGELVRRPMSPFMLPRDYAPQLTSVLSISNRIAGVGLTGGTLLAAWWLVAAATSPAAWHMARSFTLSPIGLVLLFGWTLALVYHTLAGLRHLAWDAGYGFDLRAVHASGWACVIGTVALTVLVWGVGIVLWGGL